MVVLTYIYIYIYIYWFLEVDNKEGLEMYVGGSQSIGEQALDCRAPFEFSPYMHEFPTIHSLCITVFFFPQAFGVAVSGVFGLFVFWAMVFVPPFLHRGGYLAYVRQYVSDRMAAVTTETDLMTP